MFKGLGGKYFSFSESPSLAQFWDLREILSKYRITKSNQKQRVLVLVWCWQTDLLYLTCDRTKIIIFRNCKLKDFLKVVLKIAEVLNKYLHRIDLIKCDHWDFCELFRLDWMFSTNTGEYQSLSEYQLGISSGRLDHLVSAPNS